MSPELRHGRAAEAFRGRPAPRERTAPTRPDGRGPSLDRQALGGVPPPPAGRHRRRRGWSCVSTYRPGYTPPLRRSHATTRASPRAACRRLRPRPWWSGSSRRGRARRGAPADRPEGRGQSALRRGASQGLGRGRNASTSQRRLPARASTSTEVAVPDTIQGVIMARIDRLPEAAKRALQVASVIGREFSARLVERVAAMGDAGATGAGRAASGGADLREVRLTRARVHVQTRADSRRGVREPAPAAASGAASASGRGDRGAVRRPPPRALRDPRLALRPGRDVDEGRCRYLLRSAEKARGQFAFADGARHCEQAIEILDRQGGEGTERLAGPRTTG